MKNLLLLIFITITSYGCGTAKTVYVDGKYKLCEDSCNIKFSKYESKDLYQCLSKCRENKKGDVEKF